MLRYPRIFLLVVSKMIGEQEGGILKICNTFNKIQIAMYVMWEKLIDFAQISARVHTSNI